MNNSTSSNRTAEDRARRNAELEELRERGLARQWQQLLAEAGGSMPITMDAWLAQQRALIEEDRKRQQDASDNLHKFRGVGMNESSYGSKHPDHMTPDSTARSTAMMPEYTLDTDNGKKQLYLDVYEVSNSKGIIKESNTLSSDLPSVDRLESITSGQDEPNMDQIDSKHESLAEWVDLRDDTRENSKIKMGERYHASSHMDTHSSLQLQDVNPEAETLSYESKDLYHHSESTTNISTESNIYPFNYMNILVSFGLVISQESAPPIGSYMGTANQSNLLKDILDQFTSLLGNETGKTKISYTLKENPYVVSVEQDGMLCVIT